MSVEQLNLLTNQWEDVDSAKWISEEGVKENEETERKKVVGRQEGEISLFDCVERKNKTGIRGDGNQPSGHSRPP